MSRLPGHWAFRFLPEHVTWQTKPSRLTAAAHMLKSRPPFVGPPDAFTLAFSACVSWAYVTGQPPFAGASSANAGATEAPPAKRPSAAAKLVTRFIDSLPNGPVRTGPPFSLHLSAEEVSTRRS